jgi:hypothetical protein
MRKLLNIPEKNRKNNQTKTEIHSLFLDRTSQYHKDVRAAQLTYKFNLIPTKNANSFSWNSILDFI